MIFSVTEVEEAQKQQKNTHLTCNCIHSEYQFLSLLSWISFGSVCRLALFLPSTHRVLLLQTFSFSFYTAVQLSGQNVFFCQSNKQMTNVEILLRFSAASLDSLPHSSLLK